MNRSRFIRVYLRLLAVSIFIFQSIAVKAIVVSDDSIRAIDCLIIPRYRTPDSDIYATPDWKSNIAVGIHTNQILPAIAPNRHNYIWAYNFYWGAFLNKGINAFNSIRMRYDFGKIVLNKRNFSQRHRLGIDYLWDMSNYYYGYNEARPWSLSYVAGVDLGQTKIGNSYLSYGVHTGLQLRGNLSPRTFFYIEPQLLINTNEGSNTWHRVDVNSEVQIGLGARVTSPYERLQWAYNISSDSLSWTDNFFVQLSLGAFDGISDLEQGLHEVDPDFKLSVGRWFNPKLALRASFYTGRLSKLNNKRVGLTGEGVLNIPGLFGFKMWRFTTEFSTGIRYDYIARTNGYWGSTAALQLKYFVNKQFALFTEGRYSSMCKHGRWDYEPLANLNLGVELYRTNFGRYRAKHMTMGNTPYRTDYFASFGYGQIHPLLLGEDWMSTMSTTYNWCVGYRFNGYHTFRVKGDISPFQLHNPKATRIWATLSPQYMFSITNWWMGNATHNFDMRPYIGPILSLTESNYWGHGLEAGIPIVWKVFPSIEVFVEPSYRVTFSKMLNGNEYFKELLGLSGGLSYVQGPIHFSNYFKRFHWGTDWFVASFEGFQKDLSSAGYDGVTALPLANLAIGRWFGPLGIRLSGFGSLNRKLSETKDHLMVVAYAGGRAEGMINLTSLFKPSEKLNNFEIDILGGYHSSLMYRPLNTYTRNWAYSSGPTAAMQFKYYVLNGIGLFIEPRYTLVSYQRTHRDYYDGVTIQMAQEFTDLSVGMEVRQYSNVRNELRQSYVDYIPRVFLTSNLGLSFPLHYNSQMPVSDFLRHTSPQVAFSVGHEFNAISALRGGISFTNLRSQFSEEYESGFTVSADYMLNLTNGMLGYDPTRIIDVKAIAGVNALHSTYKRKTNLGVHGGAQIGIHATENVNIFAEGKIAAYHKPSIVQDMRTVRYIGLVPTASLGTTYYFDAATTSLSNRLRSKEYENWFIDIYGGPQYDTSIYGTPIRPKSGFIGSLAVGKMYGTLGWRAGGFLSLNRAWKGTHPEMMAYGGLRLEGIVDIFNLLSPQEGTRIFTVNALGGIQPGIVYRPYYKSLYTRNWAWTMGPTTALQFVWQFDRFDLFAEPRYVWQNFNRKYNKPDVGEYAHFSHKQFEFNVGLRIRQYEHKAQLTDYIPIDFVSIEGGTIYPLHYKGSNGIKGIVSHLGSQWGIGLGRRFSRLSSVRAKVDYQHLKSQFVDYDFNGWRFGVDYMGSISNLMWGYNKLRMIDIYGFAGISCLYTDYMKRSNWGVGGGFNANIRLYEGIKLHVEPRCDLYRCLDIIPGLRTIRNIGIVPSLSAGITYEF